MKKIFLKIHLWLSLPVGLVISILCLTGAILVFETEIKEMTNSSLYFTKAPQTEPLPFEQLVPAVQKQLPDSVTISGVTVSPESNRNYRISMQGRGRTSLFVDPYTAEIKGETTPYAKGEFFSTVRRLHRWFLFQMKREGISWGKMITGTSTLIFFFIIVSGIVIWVPKTLKMLKRRLSIKANKGWFRFWYDLHLAGGIYAAIFLLLFCLTGLTWSFGWYRTGFYKVFGIETTQGGGGHGQQQAGQTPAGHGTPATAQVAAEGEPRRGGRPEGASAEREGRPEDAGEGQRRGGRGASGEGNAERGEGRRGGRGEGREGNNLAVWNKVVAQLKEENPNFKTITIQSGSASVANNRTGNTRASDRYTFDTRTGEITGSQFYKDQDKSAKIRGWIYAVHVGSWGGMITRILSFIACLIGAALPLTGYYFYFKKLSLKRKKKRTTV